MTVAVFPTKARENLWVSRLVPAHNRAPVASPAPLCCFLAALHLFVKYILALPGSLCCLILKGCVCLMTAGNGRLQRLRTRAQRHLLRLHLLIQS